MQVNENLISIPDSRISTIDEISLSRRNFIKQLAVGAAMILGSPLLAEAANHKSLDHKEHIKKNDLKVANKEHGRKSIIHRKVSHHKTLLLNNVHTEENLCVTYFENGKYIKPALREINFFLRDFRTGDVHHIDVQVLNQLVALQSLLNVGRRPFDILSGYRSPKTNKMLQAETDGVSSHSLHMEGKAIDISIEGIDAKLIQKAALSLKSGGVGYYPDSHFVHLDSGRVRFW